MDTISDKAKGIWDTLSRIDCSDKIEKKMGLSYLSWAWAWAEVMKRYPDATYQFDDPVFFQDGSCEIWVEVTINGVSRRMWLPVMDKRNNADKTPDSRKISDTRMRCLVKCLAMFGLGHYIYAGEDVPESTEEEVEKLAKEWDNLDDGGKKKLWGTLTPTQRKLLKGKLK